MSYENVELVRRGCYDAFAERGVFKYGADQVLVFSREGGRGRGSGAEVVTQPTAHLWTIRDGKAIRMQSYWERSEALEAVGLSE